MEKTNKLFLVFLCLISFSVIGQTKKKNSKRKRKKVTGKTQKSKNNVIYEYRKFEEFDFDAIDIKGNVPAPGDLSIQQRYKKTFKNKIPERKEFNRMLEKSIDTLK